MFDAIAAFASQMTGRPLAMSPAAAATAMEILSSLSPPARTAAVGAPRLFDLDGDVATIPIHGQTVNRPSQLSEWLDFPSYRGLAAALSAAIADPAVRGIILDVDSPGGDFAGAPELAVQVRRAAAKKPVVAVVDSLACSAGYLIAAAASHVVVTPSATVGSIGLVWLHLDRSGALAKAGVKPTIVHAGAFKVDGNSHQALAPEAAKRIRAQIGEAHEIMLRSVGAHRPALGVAGARATEAGLFLGARAVAAGLADAVGGIAEARTYLRLRGGAPTPKAAPGAPSTFPSAAMAPAPTRAVYPSPSEGLTPMPAFETAVSAKIAELLPRQNFYSTAAVIRATKKARRIVAANELAARQLCGQSIDDSWTTVLAKHGAVSAPPENAKPDAAQAGDEWREIIAKSSGISSLRECRR